MDNGGFAFGPKDGTERTHINQFMFIPIIVLHAMGAFVRYVFNKKEAQGFSDLFESIEEEIMRVYKESLARMRVSGRSRTAGAG
jgi:hypothetical protein